MAYYDPKEDENQDPNQQSGPVQASAGSGLLSSSPGPGGNSVSTAPKPASKPDNPGNFVGIQQYLDVNKPQAAKLGDQASGVINSSADAANQSVGALNQEAQDKVKATNPLDMGISTKIQNNAETLTDQEKQTAKDTASATYKGPAASTDLAGYQAAADATQKATDNINNSGTEQGRMSLISQINSKPRTQGETVFDNTLLQAGGGRDKLQQAATTNAGVKDALNTANTNINAQIGRADDPSTPDVDESTGAIGQTNKSQADAYKKIQDAMASWQAGFQPRVAAAQQNLVDQQNAITHDIADNPFGLDQQTLNLLGLQPNSRIFNLDLNSYLNPASANDVNAANVATPEDYARYAALADLSGDQSGTLDQANIGQAGTSPMFTANIQKLQQDIASAQKGYDQSYNTTALAPDELPSLEHYSLAAPAIGKSPAWIENVYLPNLRNGIGLPSTWTGSQSDVNSNISAIEQALGSWKKNQYYNNVVDPDMNTLPTDGNGAVDWNQITRPTGK